MDSKAKKQVVIGQIPFTHDFFVLREGTVYLVDFRGRETNFGSEEEFRRRVAEGKVRFKAK